MKNFFILLFRAMADAATGGATTPVLSSPKLTELKEAYKTAFKEVQKIDDPFSDEAKTVNMAAWKIQGEIKAEEARIQKEINDAKIAEARNQRLLLNQGQLDAYAALLALRADKKADPAKVTEAEQAFNTAKELVDNELLAKYAASKSAKPASENGTTEKSGKSSEQKAAILELARAGKNHKEIEADGYARSTVWHTINNAKLAGETFPNA
jgi:hypothetical protein